MEKTILLTYHSATLRQTEIDTLKPGQWLNDSIINFYQEYLAHQILPKKYEGRVILMDPAAVADLQYTKDLDDLIDMFGPLHLDKADLIFLPINDNMNPLKVGGGTHWGLLVYYKETPYYLDSSGGIIMNTNSVAQRIKQIINKEDAQQTLSESYCIEVVDCLPRQQNSFDCGMYILAFTETIMNLYVEKHSFVDRLKENSATFFEKITPEYITQKRVEIQAIIENLIKERKQNHTQ